MWVASIDKVNGWLFKGCLYLALKYTIGLRKMCMCVCQIYLPNFDLILAWNENELGFPKPTIAKSLYGKRATVRPTLNFPEKALHWGPPGSG